MKKPLPPNATIDQPGTPFYVTWWRNAVRQPWPKPLLLLLSMLLAMGGFCLGVAMCYWFFPRIEIREVTKSISAKELPPNTDPTNNEEFYRRKFEAEFREKGRQGVMEILHRCTGVLEVKDNEALTVKNKRAAIANKQGFTYLENNQYKVCAYFLHGEKGYGIIDDGKRDIFMIVWHTGKTKPPTINPGAIILPKGIRVEPSGS